MRKLKKLTAIVITMAIATASITTLNSVGVSAAWKQNSDGGWNFTNDAGIMQTGWINDKGTWYYTNSNGVMKTGWIYEGSNWYYTNSSGTMQNGTIQVDGKTYSFAENGKMQTGQVVINNETYSFAASGEATGNKIPKANQIFVTSKDVKYEVSSQHYRNIEIYTTTGNYGAATPGNDITVFVKNTSGKNISSITMKGSDGTIIEYKKQSDGIYKFRMPSQNVMITAQIEGESNDKVRDGSNDKLEKKSINNSTYEVSSQINKNIIISTTTGDHGAATPGNEITVFIENTSGKNISSITVKGSDGTIIENQKQSDGTYKFKMPSQDVLITAQLG